MQASGCSLTHVRAPARSQAFFFAVPSGGVVLPPATFFHEFLSIFSVGECVARVGLSHPANTRSEK